ncbi:hypothetical protein B0J14DRAFT_588194 [Halenospora varia]|nr:hypothetical protein B0J14DRAFT_588194 [Halenospora varia]
MQFSLPILLSFFLAATPALSCVLSSGSISADPLPGLSGIDAVLIDNGAKVCDGPAHIDQDGHFSLTCLPGYVFALSKRGTHTWYRNKDGGVYSWVQPTKSRENGCIGACMDRGGKCICGKDFYWDVKMFC